MQFKEFLNGVVDNRGRNPDEYTNTGRHPVLDNYLIKNEIHPNLNAVDRYISEDIYKNFLRGYVKKDMVVMTLVGNGIGNVTTIPTEDVVIIQNTIGFHTKKELLIDRYLYYYLLDKQEVIKGFNRGSGQPSIKKTDILNMEVVFPSILTQEKIVSILAPIDDKIELNNKINENLEQQAQAIFKSWFVDFEPFGGKMPEEWKETKIGNLTEIKRGGSPRPIQDYLSDKGLRWLKISDATAEQYPYILSIKEYIKKDGLSKTVFLKAGNLVLSNSATPGIPKILDLDTCIHDGWLYFPNSKMPKEYLYLLFKHIRNSLISLGNGSVFTNLKTDILKEYKTIMPDNITIGNFNNVVPIMFETIRNNQH